MPNTYCQPSNNTTKDWDVCWYCGLTLTLGYDQHTVNFAMSEYIKCTLKHFCHSQPKQPKNASHTWQKPSYGAIAQYAPKLDHILALDATNCQCIQENIGILLYNACAIDPTLLSTTLGTLATQQAKVIQATMEALTQLLNYDATHPDET